MSHSETTTERLLRLARESRGNGNGKVKSLGKRRKQAASLLNRTIAARRQVFAEA